VTLIAVAGIEFILSICVFFTIGGVIWVDANYDLDSQDFSDMAHSNAGTAVSMVILSQSNV